MVSSISNSSISILYPDDWHLHLRDGAVIQNILPHTYARFKRAVIMPNLVPPVSTVELADEYRQRLLSHVPPGIDFEPLMTLYLTDNTSIETVSQAYNSGYIKAIKLYPSGATTNSDAGVTNVKNCYSVFEKMQEIGLPLLIHGEVTSPDIDVFDREKVFIDSTLSQLCNDFPQLKIILEHITTSHAVDFVLDASDYIAATITPHHLLMNRNHMLVGGIRPHYYCLPILKHQMHQQALIKAATSGNSKFFLGTDSAPHAKDKKENVCGCAGIYSSHAAIELYAEAFDREGKLDKLEGFSSLYGPKFYGLEPNKDKLQLVREKWQVPENYPFDREKLIPLYAGQEINWKVYGH